TYKSSVILSEAKDLCTSSAPEDLYWPIATSHQLSAKPHQFPSTAPCPSRCSRPLPATQHSDPASSASQYLPPASASPCRLYLCSARPSPSRCPRPASARSTPAASW